MNSAVCCDGCHAPSLLLLLLLYGNAGRSTAAAAAAAVVLLLLLLLLHAVLLDLDKSMGSSSICRQE
jgi:hypothetical protein